MSYIDLVGGWCFAKVRTHASDANIPEAVSEQAFLCRAVWRVSGHMMASYIGLPRLLPSKAP